MIENLKPENFDFDSDKSISSKYWLHNGISETSLLEYCLPEVEVNLPIFLKSLDNVNLFLQARTMKPDQKWEKPYSLASHIFTAENDRLFSPLVNAKAGMKIYLTDGWYMITSKIFSDRR